MMMILTTMMPMMMINEPGSLCGDLGHLFFHVLPLLLLLEQFKEVFIDDDNDADHDDHDDEVGDDDDGEESHLPPPAPPARVQQGEGEIRLQTLIHISKFHIYIYSRFQSQLSLALTHIYRPVREAKHLRTSKRSKKSADQ